MTKTLTVHLEKPITSAEFLDESAVGIGGQVPGLDQANSAANVVQIPAQDSEVKDNILQNLDISSTERLSKIEDADVAQAIMDLSTIEFTYQAALASSAKVLTLSLVDFLK